MSTPFGQLLTAMITPFKDNLELDLEGAQQLAQHLVQEGNDGLVISGTTGESPTLTSQEKCRLWKAVKEAVGSEVPVVAGTGSYCTSSTIALSKKAQECGVDGLLLVAPYYNKPSARGLLEHFRAVHEATELPIMLYNIPGRCGVEIPAEVLFELADLPRVVAVKQSLPIDPVSRLLSRLSRGDGRTLATYSGDDSQTLPQLSVGGVGVVSVAGHLVAKEIKALLQAFARGDNGEASRIHQRLFPLYEVLFITSNPVPVKLALSRMGLPAGPVRQPLWPATSEEEAKVIGMLRDLELLS